MNSVRAMLDAYIRIHKPYPLQTYVFAVYIQFSIRPHGLSFRGQLSHHGVERILRLEADARPLGKFEVLPSLSAIIDGSRLPRPFGFRNDGFVLSVRNDALWGASLEPQRLALAQ